MTSVPRLPLILLASAFALAAFAAAPTLAEPAAPGPVAVPYPNTTSPDASSSNTAPRDAASGLPSGKRMHKPYTVTTSASEATSCAASNVQPVNVASDPEEGGQVARTAAKPKVSEIKVVKVMDTATPKLADSAPSGAGAACGSGQHQE